MPVFEKAPRMLKSPTGWIMLCLLAGFSYMQWPTHVRETNEPEPYWQTLDSGLVIRWEEEPIKASEHDPIAWGLSRKRMSFLVQTDQLTQPFTQLVTDIAEQDRKAVGGAIQEPLQMGDDWAKYAFFDAENRIQRHRWYLKGDQWIKVSVLYSPSMESRVQRANIFLDSVHFNVPPSSHTKELLNAGEPRNLSL